jgi:hypothetical protein
MAPIVTSWQNPRDAKEFGIRHAHVLALTKLNYNACIYGDGQPVTLSFADAVGEILTAGPVTGAPTPFKLYI